ncbi:MAG: DUF1028 domain-containing protein [Hyphomicrobiales bacterium]
MTFTAVARCPRTGMLGVGIATRAPAVGNRCPVVRPGYGAASVQLIADPRQTQLCGRLLDLGYSARKVLAELEASDPHIGRRQIGIVDSYGNTAAFSGETRGSHSSHIEGKQYVTMGNGVVSAGVVKAMARAMDESADEDLCDRLMAAVEAGGRAGGQAEGQSSAAILVFDTEPFAHLDLRVDLHPEPIGELRRIYDWFKPLIPYFRERPYDPYIARDDHWRAARLAEPQPGKPRLGAAR